MTLDPDVDIENGQVRDDILKKIDDYILNEIGPMFTKKEIYLYQLYYKDTFTTNSSFSYDLKFGKTDFYSQNTKKKLNELEFEFGPAHITGPGIYTYSQLRSSTLNYSREEYVSKLEQALKILLEDHNVTYVSIGSVVSVD